MSVIKVDELLIEDLKRRSTLVDIKQKESITTMESRRRSTYRSTVSSFLSQSRKEVEKDVIVENILEDRIKTMNCDDFELVEHLINSSEGFKLFGIHKHDVIVKL